MAEALATVAQRIIDMKKQVLADYETLKRAHQADRMKELEEYAQALANGARSMKLDEVWEIIHHINTIQADLRDTLWSSPDPETFLKPDATLEPDREVSPWDAEMDFGPTDRKPGTC